MTKNLTLNRFFRLSRFQFLPVIICPVILGTAIASYNGISTNWISLSLAIIGSISLLLAANIINDVHDYLNGVDEISNTMFPKDFQNAKILPKGEISLTVAKKLAYVFYIIGAIIGIYLASIAGYAILVLGISGTILSYIYVASPIKTDYRGYGLGELSIFFSFGPIPVLGAYYLQTSTIDMLPILASIPIGILTTCILLNHDLIFYEPYKKGEKKSLTVVLGRQKSIKLSFGLSIFTYIYLTLLVVYDVLPFYSLITFISLLLLLKLLKIYSIKKLNMENYGNATSTAFLLSIIYCILLSISFIIV